MKKKELESNLLNDLFYAAMPDRKFRKEEGEIELDEDSKKLEDKKRARYEALREKARKDTNY